MSGRIALAAARPSAYLVGRITAGGSAAQTWKEGIMTTRTNRSVALCLAAAFVLAASAGASRADEQPKLILEQDPQGADTGFTSRLRLPGGITVAGGPKRLAETIRGRHLTTTGRPRPEPVVIHVVGDVPFGDVYHLRQAVAAAGMKARFLLLAPTPPRELHVKLSAAAKARPDGFASRITVAELNAGADSPDGLKEVLRRATVRYGKGFLKSARILLEVERKTKWNDAAAVMLALQEAGVSDLTLIMASSRAPVPPPKPPAQAGKVEYFGAAGTGRRIVFLIDRSGSMFDTFDYVREELKRSLSRLKPTQSFHVMLFAGRQPQENPPKALVPATDAQKKAAYRFLAGIVPEGQTKPQAAIERAFAVTDAEGRHADLVYLLTDGEFDAEIVERIRKMQAKLDTPIKINTIGFIFHAGERLLKQIAKENGGEYRFVSRDELGQ
jgi:biopolymer transport protein ExbD